MTSADGPSCQLLDIFMHPIRYRGLQSGIIFGGGDEEDGDVEEINGEGEFVLEVGSWLDVYGTNSLEFAS
jgi:hypothetical protein